MSWYDEFIPPEIRAGGRAIKGDWSGALESELGHPGTYFRKTAEGKDEVRQGYKDAISSLGDLANSQKAFQMQGLDKAEGYYQPAMQELQSIYGKPGQCRK